MLKCPRGVAYACQTNRAHKLHIAEHKAATCHKTEDYAIAHHYLKANHWSAATLRFTAIEHVQTSPRGGDTCAKLKNVSNEKHIVCIH